jgi:hypothetical protein
MSFVFAPLDRKSPSGDGVRGADKRSLTVAPQKGRASLSMLRFAYSAGVQPSPGLYSAMEAADSVVVWPKSFW